MTRYLPLALCACVLIAFIAILSACNGGGGSVHIPPDQILYDQATRLQIELTTRGNPTLSKSMSKRYTDVKLHYKTEKSLGFTTITAKIDNEKNNKLLMSFELPAFTPKDGAYVEYMIDMKLDGLYSKRDIVRVSLGVAPIIRYDANQFPCTLRTGDIFHTM